MSAWHLRVKTESYISIISCCRFKSPLFCLLFTCWFCSSRRLLCRWTGEERRGVGPRHLDQNLLWSCLNHHLSRCYSLVEPCPLQGAATYLAPFAITPVALNPMPPRIRRSLILPRRPSTSPRLPLRMAAHSPPSWKRWACRGKTEDVAWDPNEHSVMSLSCGLSTFLSLLGSDAGMCRICHEGGGGETLLSPCDCTGTLGKVHKSCLEKWLSSSNTSYCELCHTEFTIERRPQPLTQVRTAWLKEKWLWLCDVSPPKMATNKVHVKKTRQNVFFSFNSLLIELSLRLH